MWKVGALCLGMYPAVARAVFPGWHLEFCCAWAVYLLLRWPKGHKSYAARPPPPPPPINSLFHDLMPMLASNPPHTQSISLSEQGPHGNRAAADRSRTTGWGWPGAGSGAGPVDPGDYDTVEANASMAMLPAIPCR